MQEEAVITRIARSPLRGGLTVRDMYGIVMRLKDYSKDILVTDVCILGTANMLSFEPSFRYFRNENQLSAYYRNDEQQYVPADRKTIERILAKSKEVAERTKQDIPVNLAGLEMLRQRENNGSYICFEDMIGSIKGKVEYVGSDEKISAGLLEMVVGGALTAGLLTAGAYTTEEAFRTATPSIAPYIFFGLGALTFAGTMVDGMRRLVRSAFNRHIRTAIWPVNDSLNAARKTLALSEVIMKDYK